MGRSQILELAASFRRVRTAAGAKRYGQPIGSVIVRDPVTGGWAKVSKAFRKIDVSLGGNSPKARDGSTAVQVRPKSDSRGDPELVPRRGTERLQRFLGYDRPSFSQYSPETVSKIMAKPDEFPIEDWIIRKGKDSLWDHTYFDEQGQLRLTDERLALHDRVIEDHTKDAVRGIVTPTFVLMGGGGGSGKGTLIKTGAIGSIPKEPYVHIDSDEIKMELPEYREMTERRMKAGSAGFVHAESTFLARSVEMAARAQRSNIVLDGTGSRDYQTMAEHFGEVRTSGYKVVAEYVSAPTMTAWRRNVARAQRSFRGLVPAEPFLTAHRRVSEIAPRLAGTVFDEFRLWSNSDAGDAVLVAEAFRGGPIQIKDGPEWAKFLDKAKEQWDARALTDEITPEEWDAIESVIDAKAPGGGDGRD